MGDLASFLANYGKRIDGSQKGRGYFGALRTPDGHDATELSFGFEHGGKEHLAPLLVPSLRKQELDHLLGGGVPTDDIYSKAKAFAMWRMLTGKPMFAAPNEVFPLPSD